ncbi:MAG: class C beta-lactamase-related serine hydrolase [Candidatus Thorarchaeota archaeon]|nr:MAG: class C beta-lactamase-related serine hydrolase [Candidatus Thorarchaeota archaeon]
MSDYNRGIEYMALVSILLLLLSTVTTPSIASESSSFVEFTSATRDYWPTEGWMNSTPEEQGMDSVLLEEMIDHIADEDLDVHSVIVIRHGYVVLEEYPDPYQGVSRTQSFNGTHFLYSATKSFLSCLIGMAIDKGYIDNTSQTMLSFFPNHTIANIDERKERVTLRDLLTMRSGLPWDEQSAPFNSPENDVYQLNYNTSGGVQYVLDMPMEYEPDEVFHYNTGASHLLSGIVQETTGMSTLDFAVEHLFSPLGINPYYWYSDRMGVHFGGYDLQLEPLDMAKFGYLFLNNGTWDGEQVVSSEWVNESTTTVSTYYGERGYAYQWWTMPDRGVFYAAGMYGQYIFVSPEDDLVAVFTSGYGFNDVDENPSMFRNYILGAVTEESPVVPFDFVLPATVIVVVVVSLGLILKFRSRFQGV